MSVVATRSRGRARDTAGPVRRSPGRRARRSADRCAGATAAIAAATRRAWILLDGRRASDGDRGTAMPDRPGSYPVVPVPSRRMSDPSPRYVHGHHESVLRSHRWRTAENSAAYLLPHLHPGLAAAGCRLRPGHHHHRSRRRVAPGAGDRHRRGGLAAGGGPGGCGGRGRRQRHVPGRGRDGPALPGRRRSTWCMPTRCSSTCPIPWACSGRCGGYAGPAAWSRPATRTTPP